MAHTSPARPARALMRTLIRREGRCLNEFLLEGATGPMKLHRLFAERPRRSRSCRTSAVIYTYYNFASNNYCVQTRVPPSSRPPFQSISSCPHPSSTRALIISVTIRGPRVALRYLRPFPRPRMIIKSSRGFSTPHDVLFNAGFQSHLFARSGRLRAHSGMLRQMSGSFARATQVKMPERACPRRRRTSPHLVGFSRAGPRL
ncbi:hypothetical protein EVAR_58481_1 [Eumeta japonica]|uniref:Uncharacterized protein n=1 Tax=Eumeta variegata TaxID=151549 RepID=A0A4C1YQS6_EUMVA|nr:hypothetical protein EVAR_58481_1 [Eumeta japonica]